MKQALRQCLGIVTSACAMVGITRKTHYQWLQEDPEYQAHFNELAEVSLDFGESCLYRNMQNGSDASTIFFLKTKGKKRGYIETIHNVNQNFDENAVQVYQIPDNGRQDVSEAQIVND